MRRDDSTELVRGKYLAEIIKVEQVVPMDGEEVKEGYGV
jgi:hypothetical protein